MITLNALNEIPLSEFVEKLKDKFEHSPWVAQRVGGFVLLVPVSRFMRGWQSCPNSE